MRSLIESEKTTYKIEDEMWKFEFKESSYPNNDNEFKVTMIGQQFGDTELLKLNDASDGVTLTIFGDWEQYAFLRAVCKYAETKGLCEMKKSPGV